MITRKIKSLVSLVARQLQYIYLSRYQGSYNFDMTLSDANARFQTRNQLHSYMHHYFHYKIPVSIKKHRSYFSKSRRGFGEDAFHAMWYLLLKEFKPHTCLEIGVYRGQVISLWSLISRELNYETQIFGISPFDSSGDSVSKYQNKLDYRHDTIKNHEAFALPHPNLLMAYSTDEEALALIRSKAWNLIYIDGSHDYEIALADYEICKENLAKGGLLVMDDSSLYTEYLPPMFSFAGHPGPSKVIQERVMHEMQFIGGVGHNNVFLKIQR